MLTEVEFFVLDLLPDGASSLSVLLPEARRTAPRTREISAEDVTEAMGALERRGLVRVFACDPDKAGFREATDDDRLEIFGDYRSGRRDASVIKAILDRTDLWLELTEQGRRDLFADPRFEGTYSIQD